jgi:hypothetical protein
VESGMYVEEVTECVGRTELLAVNDETRSGKIEFDVVFA